MKTSFILIGDERVNRKFIAIYGPDNKQSDNGKWFYFIVFKLLSRDHIIEKREMFATEDERDCRLRQLDNSL